jgi:glycosyltransferase involved in cell wall biosynthesis
MHNPTVPTVLFVIPSLRYGGAARQLVLLAAHLPLERCRAYVAVLGSPAPWGDDLRKAGVGVDFLGWRRPFDPRPLLALRAAALALRPNVVHAWGTPALRASALVTGALRSGRLFASALLPPAGDPPALDRFLLRRAARVVALGAAEGERYRRLGVGPARLAVVPPAVDGRPPAGNPGVALPVPASGRVLLGIGPLERPRGFREAVWAMDILRYVSADVHLVLAGTGPDRQRVESFARAIGAAGQVHFTGPVADLGPLLWRAEVVWAPSLADCGRGAVLEAMAAGRPVIASRWPGLAEVVADAGILVPPGDKAALARQTWALLGDAAARRRLGEAGRRRAALCFSPAALADACAGLYEGAAP